MRRKTSCHVAVVSRIVIVCCCGLGARAVANPESRAASAQDDEYAGYDYIDDSKTSPVDDLKRNSLDVYTAALDSGRLASRGGERVITREHAQAPGHEDEHVYPRPDLHINNTLQDILDAATPGASSEKCRAQLRKVFPRYLEVKAETESVYESLAAMSRCKGLKPSVPRSTAPRTTSSFPIVFLFMVHSQFDVVKFTLDALAAIGNKGGDRVEGPRFVLSVDDDAPLGVWTAAQDWVARHPEEAVVLDPRPYVEWADISIVAMQLLAMRTALEKWSHWQTFVVLSDSDIVLASDKELVGFFSAHQGLNFPGTLTAPKDYFWRYMLNDLTFKCDRSVVHLGWRDRRLHGDGMRTGNLFAFWTREFVDYVIRDNDKLADLLYRRLEFVTNPDELFWGSLFFNSPHCDKIAALQHENKFSALVWKSGCRSAATDSERFSDVCQHMHMQNLDWWSGQSAVTLQNPADVQFFFRDAALFGRKVSARKSADVLETVRWWRNRPELDLSLENQKGVPSLYIIHKTQDPEQWLCLDVLKVQGGQVGWKWADCNAVSPSFRLGQCIGSVGMDGASPVTRGVTHGAKNGQLGHCFVQILGLVDTPLCLSIPQRSKEGFGGLKADKRRADLSHYINHGEAVGVVPCEKHGRGQTFSFRKTGVFQLTTHRQKSNLCVGRHGDGMALIKCSRMALRLTTSIEHDDYYEEAFQADEL